jgi:excisionase family DNA binding protein
MLDAAVQQLDPAVLRFASALAALSAPAPDGDELLTIEEARGRLRVSRATIVRAIKARDIPYVRFRRTYRIPAGFINRVLAAANRGETVVIEEFGHQWLAEHAEAVA